MIGAPEHCRRRGWAIDLEINESRQVQKCITHAIVGRSTLSLDAVKGAFG
jgi:hypothetical protein